MRIRNLALAAGVASLLAIGSAAPAPANEVKKFEGTIAAPAPIVANAMAGHYTGVGDNARQVCPKGGSGDGVFYKFFDLKGDFKFFFVSGPPSTINQPDPSGLNGTFHDYDLDLYVFDAKCKELEGDGSINSANGIGDLTARKPARYAAIAFYSGAPNLKVTLEASNAKIVKK